MAPSYAETTRLVNRDHIYCTGGVCYRRSAWHYWGRWLVTGILLLLAIMMLAFFARKRMRNRRQHGNFPPQGPPPFGPPPFVPPGAPQHSPPPPHYSSQPLYGQNTGTKFTQSDGYNAHQQEGVEMQPQPPQSAYHRPGDTYAPPPGPPPPKD